VLKHIGPLITAYVLVAALVLVGAPLAAQPGLPNASSSDEAQAGDNGVNTATPQTPEPASPNEQQAPAPEQQPPAPPQPSPPVAVAASPGSVTIFDYGFRPATITIDAGDAVTWTNTGKQPHSATGSGFDTGILKAGQSASHTFNSAGTFSYHCTPHPFMKGTVVVRATRSGGGSSGGSSGGSGSGSGNSAGTGGGATTSGSASIPSQSSSSSSSLPATGTDVAILGALGLALLGLGLAIRRRAGEPPSA
jgi:amicyanin